MQFYVSITEECNLACDLRPHCRGAYEQYCPMTRLLFEKVRTSGYTGQAVDEVGLQTEIIH